VNELLDTAGNVLPFLAVVAVALQRQIEGLERLLADTDAQVRSGESPPTAGGKTTDDERATSP
jgi:hypothetical protein